MAVQTQKVDVDSELAHLLMLWRQEDREWSVINDYVLDHMYIKGMDWSTICIGLDDVLKRVFKCELTSIEDTVQAIKDVVALAATPEGKASPYKGPYLIWSRED